MYTALEGYKRVCAGCGVTKSIDVMGAYPNGQHVCYNCTEKAYMTFMLWNIKGILFWDFVMKFYGCENRE